MMTDPNDHGSGREDESASGSSLVVPLFPLPNVVLLPLGVLPLHIFEPRYRQMVADVLEADQQIAMALLSPGWEKDYYGRPTIEPTVCVGTILSHELLDDGRYNLLLRGHTRGTVVREDHRKPYRVAHVAPVVSAPVTEDHLIDDRRALARLLASPALSGAPLANKLVDLLDGPAPTPDVADLIAFAFLQDAALKQSILADADVKRRVAGVVRALDETVTLMRPVRRRMTDPNWN
jgi:Lon protease-like protein